MNAEILQRMHLEWQRAGEVLFAGPQLPARKELVDAALRIVLVGLREGGGLTLTRMAADLRTSRRALRDTLRRLGLMPPRPPRARPKRAPKLSAAEAAAALGLGQEVPG